MSTEKVQHEYGADEIQILEGLDVGDVLAKGGVDIFLLLVGADGVDGCHNAWSP